jgi:hypothetical protein
MAVADGTYIGAPGADAHDAMQFAARGQGTVEPGQDVESVPTNTSGSGFVGPVLSMVK